ncbi:MAG: flagellar hook-basal body complex protein FliE [Treponemataceae bacterium]
MLFTNTANLAYVPSTLPMPSVNTVSVDSIRRTMESSTENVDLATNKIGNSFEQTLLKAFDELNKLQIKAQDLGVQQMIDPESVDVHELTIAMEKASLSLNLATTLTDRVIKAWNEITITR